MWGSSRFRDHLIKWHREGAVAANAPKADGGGSWGLVVVNKDGMSAYEHDAPHADKYDAPWAFGSHNEMAIGLMRTGKSAAETVRIISGWSIYVGGKIQIENIAEALGRQLKEAAE